MASETNLTQSLAAVAKTGLPAPRFQDGAIIKVALADITASRYQPRTHIDEEELRDLIAQIRSQGLLQPVGVRPRSEGGFELVWGHRRVEAFKRLAAEATSDKERERFEVIPAVTKLAISDADMAASAYVENMGRSALSPLEEAVHLARMLGEGMAPSAEELATKVGQPPARVRRLLRLAAAPAVVKDALGGLMVVVGKGDDGKEVRERRALDLMAAIAFQRLWQHLQKASTTKKADERTERLIRRSLAANWSKARVEAYVEELVSGKAKAEDLDHVEETVAPLFSRTARRFVIELPKAGASKEQLEALRGAVDGLLAELAATSTEGVRTGD